MRPRSDDARLIALMMQWRSNAMRWNTAGESPEMQMYFKGLASALDQCADELSQIIESMMGQRPMVLPKAGGKCGMDKRGG